MSTLEAAYWVNQAVFIAAGGATLALIALNQYATNVTVAARRGRLEILSVMAAIYLVMLMLGTALLIGQGSYVRLDTVDAHYARWIAYGLACTGLVYIVAKWLWHMKLFVGLGMLLSLLGHTLNVFAVLSNSPQHWVWFGLSFVFWIPLILVVIFLRRRSAQPFVIIFAIIVALLVFAVYPVIMGLGHALGAVISLEAETWVYFVLDIVTKIILPFVLFFTYLPVPCALMESDELDCQRYKGQKVCGKPACGHCCQKPSLLQRAFSWTQDVTLADGTEHGILPCNATHNGFVNQQGYMSPAQMQQMQQQPHQQGPYAGGSGLSPIGTPVERSAGYMAQQITLEGQSKMV